MTFSREVIMKRRLSIPLFGVALGILAFAVFAEVEDNEAKLLSRKKRYLVFPNGSNLLVRYSLAENLVGVTDPSNWVNLIELDAIYHLPFTSDIFTGKKHKKIPARRKYYYYKHRRDRRDAYEEISTMLELQGLDGRACVLRTMCEVKHALSASTELTIFEEIFKTVFTIPPGTDDLFDDSTRIYENSTNSASHCEKWASKCHFSLLDFSY